MISKKQFCRYIEYLQKSEDLGNRLQGLFNEYSDVVSDFTLGFYVGDEYIVQLLEYIFGLKSDNNGYTTLSWWVYEAKYGKNKKILESLELTYLPEDHPYRKPVLDTAEKLYDFLLFEMEEGEKEDTKSEKS